MTINGDDGKIVFVAEGTGTKQKRFADRGLAAAGIQRGCFVLFRKCGRHSSDFYMANIGNEWKQQKTCWNKKYWNKKLKKLLTNRKRCDNLLKLSLEQTAKTKNLDN